MLFKTGQISEEDYESDKNNSLKRVLPTIKVEIFYSKFTIG